MLSVIGVCIIYFAFSVNVNVAFIANKHFCIEEKFILTISLKVCFMRLIRNFSYTIELILVCCCCFFHQNVWLSFWKALQPLQPLDCIYVCIYKSLYHVRTLFPSSAATYCTYFNWSAIINKAKQLWRRDIWLISHISEINERQLWVGAVSMEWWLNRGRVQRSGVCLCSHASLDCLLNRIYFQVWLAFFASVALYTLPCSPVTIDFAGIYSLVFWCFKPFFTSTDPFSSILSL